MSEQVIKGFKGFDKDFKCRDKQYASGEVFEEAAASICEHGMHFCENPLDVFNYYQPGQSRYAKVEASGEIDREENGDTKICSSKLKIGVEVNLKAMI